MFGVLLTAACRAGSLRQNPYFMQKNQLSSEDALLKAKRRAALPWTVLTIVCLAAFALVALVYLPHAEQVAFRQGSSDGYTEAMDRCHSEYAAKEQARADSINQAQKKAQMLAATAKPVPKRVKAKTVVQNFKTVGLEILKDEQGNPVPSE